MNPLVRGLLVIAAIALVVVVLQLYQTVTALFLIAKIAFPLAIAFFLFLLWRERREEIAAWSTRHRVVFYGAVFTMVAAFLLLVYLALFLAAPAGYDALAFVLTVGGCAYALYRVWRDAHTYS
jgi:small-conductance mechanosensitive channel